MPKAAVMQAERDGGERDGDAGGPVMDAEDFVGDGEGPVDERRFFKEGDAVEVRGDPVAGGEHVVGDLGFDGVDVVHERRRRDDGAEVDGRSKEPNYEKNAAAGQNPIASGWPFDCRLGTELIFHRLIQRNNVMRPQRW